jgi:hypothetical protein
MVGENVMVPTTITITGDASHFVMYMDNLFQLPLEKGWGHMRTLLARHGHFECNIKQGNSVDDMYRKSFGSEFL